MLGIPGLARLGFVHVLFGLAALILGVVVVSRHKGTEAHRRLGQAYVGAMLLLNGTALGIYDLYGRFGPFHVAALISLGTIAAGFVPVLLRRPRAAWMELHAYFMCWSYVGLVAAFLAEVGIARAALAAIAVAVAGGALLVHRKVPRTVAVLRRHGHDSSVR
jgi:uncharacterized membrane protein